MEIEGHNSEQIIRDKVLNISNTFFDCSFIEKGKWCECTERYDIPVKYSYWNVIYQNRYFQDVHKDYCDISLIIDLDYGQIIWPLCIYKDKVGQSVIGSIGGEVLPPIIISNKQINAETLRKTMQKCFEMLKAICSDIGMTSFKSKTMVMDKGIEIWEKLLLEEGTTLLSGQTDAYVDLMLDHDEILKKMRRTNKYSIKKGLNNYKIETIDSSSDANIINKNFEMFKELHHEVAGKKTRSDATWDMQRNMIFDAGGFLIMMYTPSEELIGSSLFQTNSGFGAYAVAAYKREYFSEPVGHVSQWEAINYMKERGIKWYNVGRRYYPADIDIPTEKQIAISHFKEGFATHLFVNHIYKYQL